MTDAFFTELVRCLRKQGIDSEIQKDSRLEVFLHGQPALFVSPKNEVFLLPEMSGNDEAGDLYHEVAQISDEVFSYVEAVQSAAHLKANGLSEDFRLLADFGGAVLAGREREPGWGYQFVTWIWDYTDAEAYLQCIREELPDCPVTGFRYETLTDDPVVRKQADDILYDLYGEENPRPLEDYQEQPDQGMTMGGI